MAAITLKALPPSLHRSLKSRAARNKRSLNQEVITLLQEAVAPSKKVDIDLMLTESRRFRNSLKLHFEPAEIDTFKLQDRK